jgi:hypothetical protein
MRHSSWFMTDSVQGSSPAVFDRAPLLLLLLALGFGVALLLKGVLSLRRSRRERDRWGDAH